MVSPENLQLLLLVVAVVGLLFQGGASRAQAREFERREGAAAQQLASLGDAISEQGRKIDALSERVHETDVAMSSLEARVQALVDAANSDVTARLFRQMEDLLSQRRGKSQESRR